MKKRKEFSTTMTQAVTNSGQWVKVHQNFTTIMSVVTIVCSAIGFGWSQWNGLSTDAEREAALNVYDHGTPDALIAPVGEVGRPQKTRKQVAAMADSLALVMKSQAQDRRNTQKLWWQMVGFEASRREHCPPLRVAAAAFYRSQFTRELRNESDSETAYTQSLNVPWLERVALARAAQCQ